MTAKARIPSRDAALHDSQHEQRCFHEQTHLALALWLHAREGTFTHHEHRVCVYEWAEEGRTEVACVDD